MSADFLPTNTCRVCLSSGSVINPLRDLDAVLLKKLISIYPRLLIDIPLQTKETPSPSKLICTNCLLSLEISHEFQLKVRESERVFWQKLAKSIPKRPVIKPELIIIETEAYDSPSDSLNESLRVPEHSEQLLDHPSDPPKLPIKLKHWPCPKCDFDSSNRNQLIRHYYKKHLQCHLCDYTSEKIFNFKRHLRSHGIEEFQIDIEDTVPISIPTAIKARENDCAVEPIFNVKTEMNPAEETDSFLCNENLPSDPHQVPIVPYEVQLPSESYNSQHCHEQYPNIIEPNIHNPLPTKSVGVKATVSSGSRKSNKNKTKNKFICPYFPCDYSSARNYNVKRHIYFVHSGAKEKQKNQVNQELNSCQIKQEITFVTDDITFAEADDLCQELSNPVTELHSIKNEQRADINTEYKFYRKIFTCFICKKTFNRSSNYQKHLRSKGCSLWLAKKPELACDYCGKMFLTPLTRSRHIRFVHLNDDRRRWKCTVCHINFKRRCHIIRHFKSFHPEHNVAYEIVFVSNKNEVTDIPAEIQTYDCQRCTQVFVSRTELRIHQEAAHNMADLFTCDICKKGFKFHREIEKHMMLHSNEHFILCPLCGMSFKKQVLYNIHMKNHHQ